MAGLACRLDATPGPGGFVGLAFTLGNESPEPITFTRYEPLSPSRLRAWVGGDEVSVAIPPTSVQLREVQVTLEPGEGVEVPTPVHLQFDPGAGYGAGEDMFRWALVSEPGPLEIEVAIDVMGAAVPACRARVEPVP